MKGIAGKVIIVTGGSSGLGRSASVLLSRNGGRVVIADRDESGGAETLSMVREGGGDAIFCRVDVSREADVRNMIEATLRHYGRLDHAFNNAAIDNAKKPLHEITLQEFQLRQDINLTGTFLCMKYEVQAMLKSGGGAIVNVSSVAGLRGNPTATDYCASKFGVVGLTQGAAIDYAKKGIRVNAIAPGPMNTPMIANALKQPGFQEWISQNTPMGRFSDPMEQAEAAMWLMSDASSYVTGICMPVDGGFIAS